MSFYNSNQSLVYSAYRSDHLQPQTEANASSESTNANAAAVVAAAAAQHQHTQHQPRQQQDSISPEQQPQVQQQQQQQQPNEMPVKRPRQNKPGQKFGAKKKSWVWVWFVQDSTDSNIAACDYCGKIIVRLASDKGSPKKLSEHLKVHKLDRHSINYSRSVPMDGFGVTYNHNGQVVSYPENYEPSVSHRPGDAHHLQHQQMAQVQHQDAIMEPSTKKQKTSDPDLASNPFELGTSSRYLCADFDNSPYSTMKFHKHLLKFLTDNKLPISVIKSQSFQQIVYDLRSNSIEDLLELTGLYNSLIEVSGYGPREGNNESENPINALTNVVARASK